MHAYYHLTHLLLLFYGRRIVPYIFRARNFVYSDRMADVVSEVRGEGGEEAAEEVKGGDENPPDINIDQSRVEPQQDTMSSKTGENDGGTPSQSSRARTLVITPWGGEGAAGTEDAGVTISSTVRRVSFQQDNDVIKAQLSSRAAGMDGTDDLRVPGVDRYTPSVSPSFTPIPPRPPSDYGSEYSYRSRHDLPWRRRWFGRRDSEWVFRPLKLKFKVKELEELYRNYVYRQQQSLVCTACLIMVFISLVVAIFFLANMKVWPLKHYRAFVYIPLSLTHTHTLSLPPPRAPCFAV